MFMNNFKNMFKTRYEGSETDVVKQMCQIPLSVTLQIEGPKICWKKDSGTTTFL